MDPKTATSQTNAQSPTDGPNGPPSSADTQQSASGNSVEPPQVIGRYRLQKKLGQGGMGAVYLAHDAILDRLVALKIPRLDPENPTAKERFLREARSAATLTHPNICPVHEIGEFQGQHYLTMAYIEGGQLADLIEEHQPLPIHRACLIVRKLAQALAEAHAKGIIHRDLKPANVMIDTRGEPIIMDFGLAGRVNPGDARLTQSGAIMGTPAYMAPEQVSGDSKAMGPATDIYALGVILYELLTSHRPFEGSTAMVLGLIMVSEPEKATRFRPEIGAELEAICAKAMSKKIPDRFRSMKELAAALTAFCQVHGQSTADTELMESEAPPTRRQKQASSRATSAYDPQATTMRPPPRKLSWMPWLIAGVVLFCGALLITVVAATIFLRIETKAGTVLLEIDQKDVEVAVDGDKITIGRPGDKNAITVEAKAGKHLLHVSKQGFEAWTQEVTFDASSPQRVKISLKPLVVAELPVKKGNEVPVKEPTSKNEKGPEVKGPALASPLFNGKDLTGWEGLLNYWSVNAGEIVGTSVGLPQPATNTFLWTTRNYRDFELSVEVKLDQDIGNSGIQIRSKLANVEACEVHGPQVEMAPKNAGGLYQEGPGGRWLDMGDPGVGDKAWKANDFNHFHIRCIGQRVTIKVNGLTTVDANFLTLPEEGIIALQIHRQKPMTVRWRNLQFKDLSATAAVTPGFTALFNGKDLTGWKGQPGATAKWKVADGALTATGAFGHLFSERGDYENFHLLVECRINADSNSGVYFRSAFGPGYLKGYEAQIAHGDGDKAYKTGSLYGMVKVAFDLIQPGEWFTQELIVTDNHIVIKLNGNTVVDFVDQERRYDTGHFALQQNSPSTVVEFRRVEVKELPKTQAAATPTPGYIALFNGKDLTGWKEQPGNKAIWEVKSGILTASGGLGNLFSTRGDFENFHFLVEARIAADGNSGQWFRAAFQEGNVSGYHAQIALGKGDPVYRTGSLYDFVKISDDLIQPGEWFTQEVIAVDDQIVIKLNGKVVVDFIDRRRTFTKGHLALEQWTVGGFVEFKRVEVKELPKT